MRSSWLASMSGPSNQFEYVMVKGEGNKGASYKYTWKPDFRAPPGVHKGKLFLQLAFWLGVAAFPIYGIQYFSNDEERNKHKEMYAQMKKKNREDRLTWLNSDDMPYK